MDPELQLRMSKKIAQLTKVIYHLNKRNEDYELELQNAREDSLQELAVQQHNAEQKFIDLQARMDSQAQSLSDQHCANTKKLESQFKVELEQLSGQLEAQKQQSLADRSAWDAVSLQLQQQTHDLQEALDVARRQLLQQAELHARELQDVQAARQQAEDASAAAAHAEQQRHSLEQEVQLQKLQQLQLQLDQSLLKSAELQTALQHSEAAWREEQAAWQAAAAQETAALEVQVASWQQQQEVTNSQLLAAVQRADRADDQVMALQQELLTLQAGAQQGGAERDVLIQQLSTATAEAAAVQSKLSVTTDRLSRLQQELDAAMADHLTQKSALVEQLQQARLQLAMEQQAAQAAGAQASKDSQQANKELARLQQQVARLQQDLDGAAAANAGLQQQLAITAAAASAAAQASSTQQQGAERQLADTLLQAAQLKAETQQLQKQLQAQQDLSQEAACAAAKQAADNLAATERRWQQQLVSLQQTNASSEAAMTAAHHQALAAQAHTLHSEFSDKLQAAEQAHTHLRQHLEQQLAAAKALARVTEDSASQCEARLQEQLRHEQQALSGVQQELRQLHCQLEQAASAQQEASAVQEALQQQLRHARDTEHVLEKELAEAKQQLRQAQQDMLQAAAQATAAAEAVAVQHQRELQQLQDMLAAQGAQQVQLAVDQKAAVLLDEAAQQAAAAAAKHTAELLQLRQTCDAQLQQQAQQHAAELQALHACHDEALRAQAEGHVKQLQAAGEEATRQLGSLQRSAAVTQAELEHGLRRDMAAAVAAAEQAGADKLQQIVQQYDERLAAQEQAAAAAKADWQQRLVEADAAYKEYLSAAKAASAAELHSKVTALQTEHDAEVKGIRQDLQAAGQAASDKIAGLQSQLAAVQTSFNSLSSQLRQLTNDKADLTAANQALQQALMDKSMEAAQVLDCLKQQQARQLLDVKQQHQQQLQSMAEEAAAVDKAQKEETAKMAAAAQAAQAALSTELEALQARWLAREPRPEDVAALAELRGALIARDEAVRVAEEQLNQLKAQMLLREDTYNRHFKNGGAGQRILDVGMAASSHHEVLDWMLKPAAASFKAGSRRATGEHSTATNSSSGTTGSTSTSRRVSSGGGLGSGRLAAPGSSMRVPAGSFKRT